MTSTSCTLVSHDHLQGTKVGVGRAYKEEGQGSTQSWQSDVIRPLKYSHFPHHHHKKGITRIASLEKKNHRYLYQYQYSIKQNQQTMPRGNIQQCKVIFKGKNDDFIVFVESLEDVEKWKKDSSIPLAQVLNGWKIFYSDKYVYTFHCLHLLTLFLFSPP